MSVSNFTTEQDNFQTRRGNGQFSTKKRVATTGERNRADIQRQVIAASPTHRSWLDEHGFTDVCADELFASAR